MMIDKHSDIPEGYDIGRLPSHVKCPSRGKRLYRNINTGDEKYFYESDITQDWVLGSTKQNRQNENNQAYGKRWYQNIEAKLYTYCYPAIKPDNFIAGHPDWKYDKNWKSYGWVRI